MQSLINFNPYSDAPGQQFDRLPLKSVTGSKASIFVRKTLRILPCEIKKLLLFKLTERICVFR